MVGGCNGWLSLLGSRALGAAGALATGRPATGGPKGSAGRGSGVGTELQGGKKELIIFLELKKKWYYIDTFNTSQKYIVRNLLSFSIAKV